ncbi:hypothetical protein HDU67_005901, partial [Dinochytrium kinnereticum]
MTSTTTIRHKEIELKLRLYSREDLVKAEKILEAREKGAGFRCFKHFDRFFDGEEGQMWRDHRTVLRLRQSSWMPERHVEPDAKD